MAVLGGTQIISSQAGGGSGGAGRSGALPEFGNYTLYVSGGTTYARNNLTGAIDFSNADAAVVINATINALATVGGRLFFKDGVYPLASATLETFTTGFPTIYYCVGFPATQYANGNFVQWIFEGESRPCDLGESGSTAIQTNGVIFNVTSAAITAAGSSFLAAIFQRPQSAANGTFSNELYFKNLGVRFPSNTRGNTGGIIMWSASGIVYDNVFADFHMSPAQFAAGPAPVKGTIGSFGLTSAVSSSGDTQMFKDCYVIGFDTGYDFTSEHIYSEDCSALYCNYAGIFGGNPNGLNSPVYHPSLLLNFMDVANKAGLQFGQEMQVGSRVDMISLDIEEDPSGWYARTTGAGMAETHIGRTSGLISYSIIKGGTGNVAGTPLFTAAGGGQNFYQYNSFTPAANPNPNVLATPTSAMDNFTRPDASTLGANWQVGAQTGNLNLRIVSNSAQVNSGSPADGFAPFIGIAFNNDQFSKATVGSIGPSGSDFFEVCTNMTTNPAVRAYYAYYAGATAGAGSGIIKFVAGSGTTLASQTSVAGCTNGDVLELRHIGTTLAAYKNGVLDPNFTNPVTDSDLSGGAPGLYLSSNDSVSAQNWSGGSLVPGSDPSISIFQEQNLFTQPQIMPGLVLIAATPTGVSGQVSFGTTSGFGNGSSGTAVTTTTKSTGTGPTTPQTVVNYLEIDIAGTKYWVPLVQ